MHERKLYVGNLNYAVTEEELTELFGQYGDVKSVKIIDGRGFGFVEMSAPEEAEQAKDALNDSSFQGRTLRIDEARPQSRKEYGGGGRGGGGRGGSRSGGPRGGGSRSGGPRSGGRNYH